MATSSNTDINPRRGEVWQVDLNPTLGAEIRKIRPVVVVSSDSLRSLPIRLIAPITGWDTRFANKFSHVRIAPKPSNGLKKLSAVDALQLRGVSLERFLNRIGNLSEVEMKEVVYAIAAVIDFQ